MPGRYIPSATKEFSPLLRHLVQAARKECPPGHADALVAFIGDALRNESSNGIVRRRATSKRDPSIQAIARAHAQIDAALAAWRRAAAATEIAEPDDAASFCAGVAFGLMTNFGG